MKQAEKNETGIPSSVNTRLQKTITAQRSKPYAVYTFRRESGGRWRLHEEDTFQDAMTRARKLYKTGRYRRVEIKKILHDSAQEQKNVQTLKVLRPRSKVLMRYGLYALIYGGLLTLLISLI